MKKTTLTIILSLLAIALLAQVPQGISHQAVIRNAANELVANAPIGIRISILQDSPEGTAVYTETHSPVSNANGLISFVIGQGVAENGVFAELDWAAGPYFIKTEADPAGGTDYTIEGVTQILSVPYALFAEKVAGSVAANIYPPTVLATEATNVESFSATFNGIVNAEGFSSTVVFQWGTTTNYGNTTAAIQSPVTGSTDVVVSANLSNLQSATTYHYRIRATNAVNISYSDDMSFTTEFSAPQLTTNTVTNILAFSATSGGNITNDGGTPVTARGVVWSTNPSPTLDDNFTADGAGSGPFTSEMTGLTLATTYYVRAYATNAAGTTYGNQRTFTTQSGIIALTTNVITDVTANSATSGGNITADGGTPVTARGVVWSTNPSPTLDDNFTVDGTGTGSFTSEMTGLTLATTYYVRAYATNAVGTTYGNQRTFTTQSGIIALTTNVITDVTANSATSGGNITADGGTPVTARGVVWSTNPSPTLDDNFTVDGSGTGSFTSEMTGLVINTTYYVRAYATNAVGTSYGNERTFSTGVGIFYQGGIIAYILQPGDPGYVEGEFHGLIAAPSDQSTAAQWGCYGTLIGGTSTAIGTGAANTAAIVAGCSEVGRAARICNDLELNGYSDWYLPSKDELNKLYINRIAIGGFAGGFYWSSSEYSSDFAWLQYFSNGDQYYSNKDYNGLVRAVRAF